MILWVVMWEVLSFEYDLFNLILGLIVGDKIWVIKIRFCKDDFDNDLE